MMIAAYCRVSTRSDDQLDSLRNQKEFFEEYAHRNGHTLVKLYADEGISGTRVKKRQAFAQLMQEARLGIFQQVVVKDVSRLARNTVDFLQSIRQLKSYGVNILFLTANMESLGESEFILTVFGAMAQEESANLSKRVKFGKKINAKKGRVPQRIFGYNRVDKFTLEINYEEAKVVRDIYRLYLEQGFGYRMISMELNRLGCKTKFGCEWNPRGVRRVLTNSIYCGQYVNNKYEITDYLTGKQERLPVEEHFHHERAEWAIVSLELFNQAQAQMDIRREKHANEEAFLEARYSCKHIFSTLIKCEHCGRSFCRRTYKYVDGRIRAYWICTTNNQFTSEKCDNIVKIEEDDSLRELQMYFTSLIKNRDRFAKEALSAVEKERCEVPHSFSKEDTEKRRKRLTGKKEKYQEMFANDVIAMAELKEKTASIDKELKLLEDDSRKYEQSLVVKKDAADVVSEYLNEVNRFLALETVANMDLRRVIKHITVNRDGNVRIFLKELDELPQQFAFD